MLALAGLLQPLPIPYEMQESITVNFIEGLLPSNGKNIIFIVMD